jgi:putative membrane-bound dehydrogenase-like protein
MLGLLLVCPTGPLPAQTAPKAQWIWYDGDAGDPTPAAKCYFRHSFDERYEVAEAKMHITCDNRFVLYVNGKEAGRGSEWREGRVLDVKPHLVRGKNVIAVEATNDGGPAGLVAWLVRLTVPGNHYTLISDHTWKCTTDAAAGWQKLDFDDATWKPARSLGEYGKAATWSGITWNGKRDYSRFEVAEGFAIDPVAEPDVMGSIVNLTFDTKGRPVVSRERGPVFILEDKDHDGTFESAKPYSEEVTNCQGMLAYDERTLYLIGEGPGKDKARVTGLFRLRDDHGDDTADRVELIHAFQGGMGEHGPHAIVAGPDGYLYLCSGNHAWVTATPEPNSPVEKQYEADLLPRYEDAGGHAVGIRVPGGTIWRLDPDGKRFTLETAGFRNEYDIAFNSLHECFSFDSDMEWDEDLPWYRPVRVNHCPPGAEFGWRSGSQKWPDYYVDSLPATVDIGRGSPCGVVFYNHTRFPPKYRDALFITDWSYGRIFAIHLKRDGATFRGEAEPFVLGKPLNVTDIEVAPDGSVFFSTGGRGTEGGLFRIRPTNAPVASVPTAALAAADAVVAALDQPQPQSAWGRARIRMCKERAGDRWTTDLEAAARNAELPAERRLRAIACLMQFGPEPALALARGLASDRDPEVRSQAAVLLARHPGAAVRSDLVRLLDDPAPLVVRRALEGFVRTRTPAPLEKLIPHLASTDRFLRFSARLALERLDPLQWRAAVVDNVQPRVAIAGIIALNKLDAVGADPLVAQAAFQREWRLLRANLPAEDELDVIRCLQLTLIHTKPDARPALLADMGQHLVTRFPTGQRPLDRELARSLCALQAPGTLEKLLAALERCDSSNAVGRADAIHYARCLVAVVDGWTPEAQRRYFAWFDRSKDWNGGHSYRGYLANFLRDAVGRLSEREQVALVADAASLPRAAARAAENVNEKSDAAFVPALAAVLQSPEPAIPAADVLRALGRTGRAEAEAILLRTYERNEPLRDAAVQALGNFQNARNWPLLVRALDSKDNATALAALRALQGIDQKPDGPAPYRAAIQAGIRLGENGGWDAVLLARQWAGKHFGHKRNQWKAELDQWQKWYAEKFPNAESATLADAKPAFQWTYDQLLAYLEVKGRAGSIEAGRKLFEAAVCAKCHRIEQVGTGVGPDLTTLSSRFKRRDILEAIVYPSRALTDQYKSFLVATKDGQVLNGMKAPDEGDHIVLLLSDASTVKLPKAAIEEIAESKQSVMPDGLLNQFSLEQIADLFAFLESGKAAVPAANEKP